MEWSFASTKSGNSVVIAGPKSPGTSPPLRPDASMQEGRGAGLHATGHRRIHHVQGGRIWRQGMYVGLLACGRRLHEEPNSRPSPASESELIKMKSLQGRVREFQTLAGTAQQALRRSDLEPALRDQLITRLIGLTILAFDRVEELGVGDGVEVENCRLELTELIEEFETVCATQYDDGGRRRQTRS